MGHVHWYQRPHLRAPVVVIAFEGWNDAGEAASSAADHLHAAWDLEPLASIDPEEFFDFTATRPHVQLTEGQQREISWPETSLWSGPLPGTDHDAIVVRGIEPHLRWRTFCDEVLSVFAPSNPRLVVTLGALLSDVPHTRPTRVIGAGYDDAVVRRLGLERSQYEGPTGIIGVLHSACADSDLAGASLWAAVPTYVPGTHSPKAQLALVERCADLFGVSVETTELEIAAASYVRQLDDLVAEDPDTLAYVTQLEEHYDSEQFAADVSDPDRLEVDSLLAQVEEYLRDQ